MKPSSTLPLNAQAPKTLEGFTDQTSTQVNNLNL